MVYMVVAQTVKNLPAMQDTWVPTLGREEILEKGMATTPLFLPGEFHGLYSPWGHRELDTIERLKFSFFSYIYIYLYIYFSQFSHSVMSNSF